MSNRRQLVYISIISFLLGVLVLTGIFIAFKTPVFGVNQAAAKALPATKTVTQTITLGPNSVAKTVKDVSTGVVSIETTVESTADMEDNPFFNDPFFREFFGNGRYRPVPQKEQGLGTGVIIDKKGLILTNEHVIHGATDINVKLAGDTKSYKAEIVGKDSDLDLAIIKIKPDKELHALPLGDSDAVEVGDWVIAIGYPYGLDHTVTVGVISAKGRPITIAERQYKNLLQTDAAINPGNSGGPLLNLKGEVIGINTAVNAQAQGIGFAIPVSTVKDILQDLLTKGKIAHPWVGIYMQPLNQELADYLKYDGKKGIVVSDVVQGSPAEKAGLQQGDIILSFNDKEISTPDDLANYVKKLKVGEKFVLEVFKSGHKQFITVVVGEKPDNN